MTSRAGQTSDAGGERSHRQNIRKIKAGQQSATPFMLSVGGGQGIQACKEGVSQMGKTRAKENPGVQSRTHHASTPTELVQQAYKERVSQMGKIRAKTNAGISNRTHHASAPAELIQHKRQVAVLELGWQEQVLLAQRVHCSGWGGEAAI